MSTHKTISLIGTFAATGVLLHRLLFGAWSLGVYAILLAGIALLCWLEGVSALIIACALLFFPLVVLHAFLEDLFMKERSLPEWQRNDADFLAFGIVRRLKSLQEVSLINLLDAALKTNEGAFIVQELGRDPQQLMRSLRAALDAVPDTSVAPVLRAAHERMTALKRTRIGAGILLAVCFERFEQLKDLLNECDLAQEDLVAILRWERFHELFRYSEPFWTPDGLLQSLGSIGRSWVMGYTNAIDALTEDLSASVLWKCHRHVRIHADARANALRILEKSDLHDLLIIGRVGVGKKVLVEHLAYDIRIQERRKSREYTRVLILKTEELLSGVRNPDMFLLQALKKAQESGNFILVIHNLALMLQSGGEKIRAILMKFIREKNVQLVGIISAEDYHRLVRSDPMLDHFFEKIMVEEPADTETLAVLMEHFFQLVRTYNVHVTYKALRSVIDLSRRYLPNQAFPGKAISVLQDAMMLAQKADDAFVEERHIREIVSQKGNINVMELSQSDRDRLLNLQERMTSSIIGQEDAVHALVNTLKRAGLEMATGNRPLGTFLFLGPTGVGKTHTAKVLANEYFGSADAMIRFDMNEFSTESSIAGIVGSAEGETSAGYLAQCVQDRPFSLILLDEIEKAHPKVINLFLQILDEGTLIDYAGMKTDFRNTVIIATSNAGALFIRDLFRREASAQDHRQLMQEVTESILHEKVFSPEFLNRFNEVILFHPLSKDEAARVAMLMLTDIVEDMKTKRGINLKVEEEVVQSIVERGYSREFGAREMRRVITDTIENQLADYMLTHEVKRGDEVVIRRQNTAS
ncbi:MAG: AAA family ATPase [Candidatus Peribacteraceae bacterium]